MTLTFYTNPMSRGRIARWMLEETGADYETIVLDYGPAFKSPEYLQLNPMGKVPTIVHDGHIVTECAAICLYLADAFPKANLTPDNRADYYRWILFAAGPVEAAVTNKAMGFVPPPEKEGMVGYGNFDTVRNTLETAVATSDYIAGNRFTAADVYVGSQIGWGLQFGTIPATPALTAYWDRIKDRPARLRADEIDNALIPKET
jgi:glutathione S-transferase